MATVRKPPRNRLILQGEPWESYVRLLNIFDGRRHVRITYDRGLLEIMTLSPDHEGAGFLIAQFIVILTRALGLPLAAYGTMTFRRRKKQRGLEPDGCFWIQNEAKVRSLRKRFDPKRDPPPDLVLEVDIESSSANRMGVYRTMGVPEVWRYDGKVFQIHVLAGQGYAVSDTSRTFPQLKSADLAPFLAMRGQADLNAILNQFEAWVRGRIAAGWK
jgi:Uma2 family endonuclease